MDFSLQPNLNLSSVEDLPGVQARAAFTVNSASVFKEETNIVPVIVNDDLSYIPWGGDNRLPYNILELIEKDETLSTCQLFNTEIGFSSGLQYNCNNTSKETASEVSDFLLDNDIPSYFLGVCQDFKHFGFAVSLGITGTSSVLLSLNRSSQAPWGFSEPLRLRSLLAMLLFVRKI